MLHWSWICRPFDAIMAEKCKTIQFTVVDIDESRIKNWNEKIWIYYQSLNLV